MTDTLCRVTYPTDSEIAEFWTRRVKLDVFGLDPKIQDFRFFPYFYQKYPSTFTLLKIYFTLLYLS